METPTTIFAADTAFTPLRLAGQGSGTHAAEGSGCGPSPSRAETGFVSSSSDERTQKLYRGTPDLIVSVPDKIAIEKLFSVKVSACVGKDSEAPRCIRVYAGMPMHGHGTNYKPSERKPGPGHSAFNGMLFCMPGNWNLTFDGEDGGKCQQLPRKVKIGR